MINIFMEILKVIFLGIVEGITEWLPISSTGHMLLVDEFISLDASPQFKEMFFVVIQLGAILAVVLLFWQKMFPFQFKNKNEPIIRRDVFSLWFKTAVACIPGAIVTILFDDYIDKNLHTPIVIGALLIGLSRVVAAEFTFFLAVPVMFGLSGLKILKFGLVFTNMELLILFIGMVVAFLVSVVIIKFLMNYIKSHDFKFFGWYRIILGTIVLLNFLI